MPQEFFASARQRQDVLDAGFDVRNEAVDRLGGEINRQTAAVESNVAQLDPAIQQADARADVLKNQLRQAGMLQLANDFEGAQRRLAFDAARRGTTGGSTHLERQAGLEGQRERGAASLFASSSQQADQQRRQDLAPLLGFKGQLLQGDPLDATQRGLQGQRLSDQGQSLGMQFDLNQSQLGIDQATEARRAQQLRAPFSFAASGIDSFTSAVRPTNLGPDGQPIEGVRPLFGA